jgi:hypothetical protein
MLKLALRAHTAVEIDYRIGDRMSGRDKVKLR